MKKQTFKVLMLVFTLAITFSLPMSAEKYLTGDLNGDGLVNTDDAIYLLRYVLDNDRYPLACDHDIINHESKEATCTEIGWNAYETCEKCGYSTYIEIEALGHNEINHEAKSPTCIEIGWDAYVSCSRCDYKNGYKEKIATDHNYVAGICSICSAPEYFIQELSYVSNGDGTCYVSGRGYCTDTDIIVPKISPTGDSVTSIGNNAFYGCTNLTSVSIPDSVTSIGNAAFYMCTGLTNVTVPDSVTSIGDSAFGGCSSLESITLPFVGASTISTSASPSTLFGYIFGKSNYTGSTATKQNYSSNSTTTYYIPTSLKSVTITGGNILHGAFYNCKNIVNMTIGDEVTIIEDRAFQSCTGLTCITIPDSVTSIGRSAFIYCTGLTNVTIGNGVKTIGSYAFCACSNLKSVTISDSIISIGNNAFDECPKLTNTHITDISAWCNISFGSPSANPMFFAENLFVNNNLLSDLVIPDNITSIGCYAFYRCTNLTSITIPDSVTNIGKNAFYDCTGLTSVTIPDSVTTIEDYTFYNCTNLTSVTIPNNVTSIGEYAFCNCTNLISVTIPNSVTSLGAYALQNCTSLVSITLGNGVTAIGDKAFYNCNKLTSITIPNSVISIGKNVLQNCTTLTSIMFNETNTWYRTTNQSDWRKMTNGEQTDVTNSSTNAMYFKYSSTGDHYIDGYHCGYAEYYWYKE